MCRQPADHTMWVSPPTQFSSTPILLLALLTGPFLDIRGFFNSLNFTLTLFHTPRLMTAWDESLRLHLRESKEKDWSWGGSLKSNHRPAALSASSCFVHLSANLHWIPPLCVAEGSLLKAWLSGRKLKQTSGGSGGDRRIIMAFQVVTERFQKSFRILQIRRRHFKKILKLC